MSAERELLCTINARITEAKRAYDKAPDRSAQMQALASLARLRAVREALSRWEMETA